MTELFEKDHRPDFLIIPFVLYRDSSLRHSDRMIYAVVYWFFHLKEGRCFASNQTIADILGIGVQTVEAGLTRLERSGFILRQYNNPEKRRGRNVRSGIVPLVRFSKTLQTEEENPSNEGVKNPSNEGENNNNLNNNKKDIESIYSYFKEKIQPRSRLTDGARKKVAARLKNFSADEIKTAIENFSNNKWQMDNNSDKGLSWFCRSDEKMEYYINMKDERPRIFSYFSGNKK